MLSGFSGYKRWFLAQGLYCHCHYQQMTVPVAGPTDTFILAYEFSEGGALPDELLYVKVFVYRHFPLPSTAMGKYVLRNPVTISGVEIC